MGSTAVSKNTLPAMYVDDPDQMFVCPYDPVHVVRACRFNRHLRLCRRNHGGFNFKICHFNQSHHVPEPEFEYHIKTCPDKDRIRQDVERAKKPKSANILPEPDFHPIWNKPETDEDWDEEVREEAPNDNNNEDYEDDDEDEYLNGVDNDHYEEEVVPAPELMEEIMPEKPANWEMMTPVQKKNYKRKYKKQQERLKRAGVITDDPERPRNPEEWTEDERKERIKAILSKYPLLRGKTQGDFVDYKSILNQYCQKEHINPPSYRPCASDSPYGGFGAECIVKSEVYRSHGHLKTKKEADHNAAYWALLKMDISLDDPSSRKPMQARTAAELQRLKEGDELRRLAQAGQMPAARAPIRQPGAKPGSAPLKAPPPLKATQGQDVKPVLIPPNAFTASRLGSSTSNDSQLSENIANMSIQNHEQKAAEDEWTTVKSRKSGGVKSAGRDNNRGRGRGRGRGTGLGPL